MGNYDVLTTKRYYKSPNEMEDKDYKSKCIMIIILKYKHDMNSARGKANSIDPFIIYPNQYLLLNAFYLNIINFIKKPCSWSMNSTELISN